MDQKAKLKAELPERLKEWVDRTWGDLPSVVLQAQGAIKQTTAYDWQSGRSLPGADAIVTLHELGCNTVWLLTGDGPMFNDTVRGRYWAEKNGTPLSSAEKGAKKPTPKKAPPEMIAELEAVIEKWR